jgi:hypothetical protein
MQRYCPATEISVRHADARRRAPAITSPNATVPDAARSPRKGCDAVKGHASMVTKRAIEIGSETRQN